MTTVFLTLLPLLALALDLLWGDPARLPHPVRGLGLVADRLEIWGRRLMPGGLFFWGGLSTLILAGGAAALAHDLSRLPWVGWLVALYLAWSGLALRGLLDSGRAVARQLEKGDLPGARVTLSGLVSRETAHLDADGVRRALAETVSENLNDAFVAPFFWLCLLGPGGLWFHKTVSTLDSMWGYRDERYERLGKFPARLDDLLAYIPARITALVMILTGALMDLDWRAAKAYVAAAASESESPNAGWPMSAAAWLCGARVGGPAIYFGRTKDKPWIGPEGGFWDGEKLETLFQLCLLTAALTALFLFLGLGLLRLFL
ncbi:MAG TPA: adenosylcobinamide-phosphate synthase CbiB [Desulfovibrio sp.]|uniref:adenosylcobinamide-phosphate synthase CbiB n=1 Tax=Desulfovibrio sp. TaxID=885 RepID=UPI002C7F6C6A|nr:adenosylcobinamide-phosphate synthase CbiB [Desulfovibrio sp.]HMM38147.1 adenosylcobinamide-phosphate synthase CbiB [Desulfovibrio sp.]